MTIDPQALEKIYRAKEQRRKDLAQLPFHEKIEILVASTLPRHHPTSEVL